MRVGRRFGLVPLVLTALTPTLVFAQDKSGGEKTAQVKSGAGKGKKKKIDLFGVSKLPKVLEEAPAIVTVHDRDFVERFGFVTLNDVLRITPGFDVRTAGWFDTPATRGMSHASLLMIDGTPINSHLTNYFPAGHNVDMWNYKRMEVISGPAGVLWGAHSLLGVVNLLTLDGQDINGVRGRVALGSRGFQRYGVQAGGRQGDWSGFVSVSYHRWRGPNVAVDGTTLQSVNYGDRNVAGPGGRTSNETDYSLEVMGKLRYRGFTLFARVPYSRDYFQASEEGGLLAPGDNGFRRSDDWVLSLSYARQFFRPQVDLLVKTYLYRNVLIFDNRLWSSNSIYPNGFGVYLDQGLALKFGALAEVGWKANFGSRVSNTLTGGVDYIYEMVDDARVSVTDNDGFYSPYAPLIRDAGAYVFSAYARDELRFFDRFAVAGGVRANYADSYRSKVLLSGSALARVWKASYIKAQLTQGLRPPTMVHRFGLAPYAAPQGNYQDPDAARLPIQAGVSTAYQLEVISHLIQNSKGIKDLLIRGDVAFSTVQHIKQLEPAPHDPGVQYWLPRVSRDIVSAEAWVDLRLKAEHRFWASYNYNKVSFEEVEGVDLPQTGPRHAVSFGGSIRLWRTLDLVARGTFETGITRAILSFNTADGRSGPLTEDAPSVFLLSAGIRAKDIYRTLTLSLFAHNLLDQTYSHYVNTNVYEGSLSGAFSGQALAYNQPGLNVMFSAHVTGW